ncbi:hypothetical protein SBRCBS47491_006564 [Sporothrix bragantina]|uniref:50S ribosomal protein l24 n=1 Tax=Sporothrix bragantina TaxID=671064 RepID=A0ABP0C5Z0_9PEZI
MAPSPFTLARASQRIASASASSSASSSSPSCSLLTTSSVCRLAHTSQQQQQQIRGYKQVVPAEGPPIPSPTAKRPDIPPYPLGPRQLFKQSNKGLYGNARIQFGNTVSRQTAVINPQKNRRKWWPNIQEKRLHSESLGVAIRTRVNTRVLRTIDKVGGLDEYLLGSKPARIAELGPWGWRLRWRIMQTPAVQERFRAERVALGLPAEGLYNGGATEAEIEAKNAADELISFDRVMAEETQKMIDEEDVFDMAPQEGFMAETGAKKSS